MNLTEGEKPSPPFLWFQSLGDERILAPWLKKPRTELEVKTRNCDWQLFFTAFLTSYHKSLSFSFTCNYFKPFPESSPLAWQVFHLPCLGNHACRRESWGIDFLSGFFYFTLPFKLEIFILKLRNSSFLFLFKGDASPLLAWYDRINRLSKSSNRILVKKMIEIYRLSLFRGICIW